MKIGILTSGGDCPGINATIRGVGKTAINHYGMEVVGILNGFSGILKHDTVALDDRALSGILNLGGTILGTAREKVFRKILRSEDEQERQTIKDAYDALGLDGLVCIGGNGTQRTTWMLSEMGLNVVGVPKTIDNDVFGTEITFGFDTAVGIATDAIDRLHSTASSHRRVMVIELMGHRAGWITLHAGMAGGADIILLPELGYNMKAIIDKIKSRTAAGKPYSIVAVAEGIEIHGGSEERPGTYFAREIEAQTGIESRETVLGYIQRGGSPSSADRNLGTLLGSHAAKLLHERKFGRMAAVKNGKISDICLSEVAGKLKLVTPDTPLIQEGEQIGISFGI